MKTINHTCDECDSEFQIRYDVEKCEDSPTFCPFCSSYILDKDEYVDDDE
jgi:predicted  nucleic acid-binding Zn-ribbon protein